MAISTKAKAFLSSPVAQKVVNDIYSGQVVFSVTANRSILADNYKPRAIEIYNPQTAPILNHYRLVYLSHINLMIAELNSTQAACPKVPCIIGILKFCLPSSHFCFMSLKSVVDLLACIISLLNKEQIRVRPN